MSDHTLAIGDHAYFDTPDETRVPCIVKDLRALDGGRWEATVIVTKATKRRKKTEEVNLRISTIENVMVYPRTASYLRGGVWSVSHFTILWDLPDRLPARSYPRDYPAYVS